MRRILLAMAGAVTLSMAAILPTMAAAADFTCAHFQDPTIQFVWSKVCHF